MPNIVKPPFDEAGAQVLTLRGKPIDWKKPPLATKKVKWSKLDMYGKPVIGSLRTIAWLDRIDALCKKRFGKGIVVIQPCFNKGVAASEGTHDYDACLDVYIPGVPWYVAQRFLRANGFACWYRHPPLFGNHIHGFVLPPREGSTISDDWAVQGFTVGKYVDGGWSLYHRLTTSSQIADYYNHAFGLYNQHEIGSDKSWFPGNPNDKATWEPAIRRTIFNLDAYIARRADQAA